MEGNPKNACDFGVLGSKYRVDVPLGGPFGSEAGRTFRGKQRANQLRRKSVPAFVPFKSNLCAPDETPITYSLLFSSRNLSNQFVANEFRRWWALGTKRE